jgi:uncharacterized protein YoxC
MLIAVALIVIIVILLILGAKLAKTQTQLEKVSKTLDKWDLTDAHDEVTHPE